MSARIVTYHSLNNADPGQQWMGFIETGKGRIAIWFPGATEDELKAKVRKFWAEEKPKAERHAGKAKNTEAATE